MSTILNHLKKNESLEDRQLILINSNEKDKPEQRSNRGSDSKPVATFKSRGQFGGVNQL